MTEDSILEQRPLVLFRRVLRHFRNIDVEKTPALAVDPSHVVAVAEIERFYFDGSGVEDPDKDSLSYLSQRGRPHPDGAFAYCEIELSTRTTFLVFGNLAELSRALGRELKFVDPEGERVCSQCKKPVRAEATACGLLELSLR